MTTNDRFRLDGKRALVTGGSKGIGLGIATVLASCGAELILVARDEGELQQAAETIQKTGGRAQIAPFDLSRVDEIGAWYEALVARCGPVDILVNAAGMTRRGPAETLSLADWNHVIQVNLSAVFALCQAFGKERITTEQPGKIINIASLMTAASRPGTSAYTASKGGLGQLTKALAVDWASKRIHVNAVAPGYIATNLTQPLQADAAFDAWVQKRCPLGRWGQPEDIGWPVAFLASSAADFITGEILYVDGGWMATF